MTGKPNAASVAVLKLELKPVDACELVRHDELLSRAELVRALGADAFDVLALGFARRVPADTELFREAQAGDSLYLVLKGEVELVRGDGSGAIEVGSVTKGGFFGEGELLDGSGKRHLTAHTRDPVEVLELPRAAFTAPLKKHPELEALLARVRDERARTQDELSDFLDRW